MAKFEHINEPSEGSALEKPEKLFLTGKTEDGEEVKEYITSEDIDRMAYDIAEELRRAFEGASLEEKKVIIINSLCDDAIMDRCSESFFPDSFYDIASENREELKLFDIAQNALARIRDDIIERLQSWSTRSDYEFLKDVHFSSEYYSNGLAKLEGDKLLKDHKREHPLRRIDHVEARKEAMEILVKLQADPNQTDPARHFIARVHDADIGFYDEIIMNELDVTSIRGYLDVDSRKDPKEIKQTWFAFLDCMKGAKYLADNGLIIGDLHLGNLTIDNNTGRGKLIDFKSLYKKGIELEGRRFWPSILPEFFKEVTDDTEVVHQLGRSMKIFLAFFSPPALKQIFINEITKLSEDMTKKHPDDREYFGKAIERFEKIIEEMD